MFIFQIFSYSPRLSKSTLRKWRMYNRKVNSLLYEVFGYCWLAWVPPLNLPLKSCHGVHWKLLRSLWIPTCLHHGKWSMPFSPSPRNAAKQQCSKTSYNKESNWTSGESCLIFLFFWSKILFQPHSKCRRLFWTCCFQ